MRPLTKRKTLRIHGETRELRFPGGGIEGLRGVFLFLLLGAFTAALDVNSLEAQENLADAKKEETKEGVVIAPTTEGSGHEGAMSGALLEGAKSTRGDLRLGASVSLGLESNGYVWGSRDHESTSTASGEVSLGKDSFTLTTRLAASKVNDEYEEWEWAEDLQMSLSRKPWKMSRELDLGTGLSVTLPMTEYSRKYSLLDQGVGVRGSLIWNLNRTLRGLKLTSSVRGTNFQYATPVAFDGRSNEEWRFNTRIVADYQMTKTLLLSVLLGRTWAWTVNGNPLDRYESSQSLSWQPYELTSLTLGHSRGGNILKSDGNSNVALYNEGEGSTFYIELGLDI